LIEKTNCNPETPEYNSVKFTNKRDPYGQISDGTRYKIVPKSTIVDDLTENKRSILQEYIDLHGYKYSEKIRERYQRYVDELDDEGDAKKDLDIAVIGMILDISSVIGSDEWSKRLLKNLKK
jgi:hypothetical protein